jgi:hypothetical protein
MRPPSQPVLGYSGMHLPSQTAWEAYIGKITVPGQPGKKLGDPHLKKKKKLNVLACTCHPHNGGKLKVGGSQSRLVWAKSKSLSQQKGLEVWLKQ